VGGPPGLTGISLFGVFAMKKVWMKPYACSLTLAAMFLGVPTLGRAQSIQQRIDHLNHCSDLTIQDAHLHEGINSISEMISYKKGTLSFGSDSEDLKSQMLRKVEALEAENGTSDLEALKRKLLTKSLEIVRTQEEECSDTDQNKSYRSGRLNEIGSTLDSLGQAEDAIPILRRCMELDPDFAPCPEQMGVAFFDLNRYPEAKEAFNKTIEIGGFSELNAQAITKARLYLELINQVERDQEQATVNEEAKPMQHSFGTGFFVSSDGEILTNNHVVAGCRNLTIKGGLPVQVISRNPSSDLALVKAEIKPDQIAVFRSGTSPKVGDTVVTFGFPLPGLLSSEGNVSTGILSATTGLQNDIRFVQISAPVQPGNSGGPVFDTSGHVVGVVVAKLDTLRVAQSTGDVPQNVNFAVHWSEVRALLDEQGVKYKKLPSQQAISTSAIAKIGAEVSVTLDCTQ
jgi:S1-C subfamily serine protease